MGFYVSPSWLQAVHYYYFCVGIFSFAASVVFSSFPNYAILFVFSYILNSGISWYLSWWIHKRVKEQIILNYRRYFLNHVVFAVASVGVLALLLYFNFATKVVLFNSETQREPSLSLVIPEFMDVIIGFNYFAFFTALMWSLALKFDVINRAFTTYNSMVLGRAKKFAAQERKKLKIGTLVPDDRFRSYRPGTSDKIDSILMEIWKGKKSPTLEVSVAKLELAVCEDLVDEMNKRIHELGHSKNASESDVILISNYQKLIDKYSKESYRYEQKIQQEEAQQQT